MWENRTCSPEIVDMLRSDSVLFFINADTIKHPRWVVDEADLMAKMDIPMAEGDEIAWEPQMAPTQVQVVDLLQLLSQRPLDIGPRKLTVLLSAWDRVEDEKISPAEYLGQRLPLLNQYLTTNRALWKWTVSGLSAQGGVYDDPAKPENATKDAERLRKLDQPSDRIKLVNGDSENEDLTLPFVGLVG